uniref:Uncharacterized protein n=1 Tax=Panagrolaimus davidi TaxID=227884 RepID=A0A914QBM4_9BILA
MSQQQQNSPQFILQSKIDNQKFTVDKSVMEASTLLKNICDITDVTEPIIINCPGASLEFFISLIKNENDKNLFETFTAKNKQTLIKLIQDLCILDSDIFLNSAADYILGILRPEKGRKMDWNAIRKYFGFESDFTAEERKIILESEKLEYLLSINTKNFTFPFPNKNIYSLKTDFSTPMNILISRIIQRSNPEISHLLSLINKTIKNEIDRYPIKLLEFRAYHHGWILDLNTKRGFRHFLKFDEFKEIYFNALKKRKIIASKVFKTCYDDKIPKQEIYACNSSKFPISKNVEVSFSKTYKSMYNFDLTKICCSSIYILFYSFNEKTEIKFEEVYNHLIAKDLSKKIKMEFCDDAFHFFHPKQTLRFYKKENASKFYKLEIICSKIKKILPAFLKFLSDYMEDDGIIGSSDMFFGNLKPTVKDRFLSYYPVSDIKEIIKI